MPLLRVGCDARFIFLQEAGHLKVLFSFWLRPNTLWGFRFLFFSVMFCFAFCRVAFSASRFRFERRFCSINSSKSNVVRG